jgi:hypothetical protein
MLRNGGGGGCTHPNRSGGFRNRGIQQSARNCFQVLGMLNAAVLEILPLHPENGLQRPPAGAGHQTVRNQYHDQRKPFGQLEMPP